LGEVNVVEKEHAQSRPFVKELSMLRSQGFKKLAAIAGAGAFLMTVFLGVGFAQPQASTRTASSNPGATLGQTATTTTPRQTL
jgi:hypothetical protein